MKHANATSGFDELRPIFILGIMHRSGTNLLQDLLCLHPDCEPGGIIWEDGLIARAGPLIEYVNYLYKFWDSRWHIQEILGPSDLLYNCLGDGLLAFLHMQFAVRNNDKDLSSTSSSRRLVTKTMWFNGTAISNKAQRALRNEQVTIIAHNTGFVHYLYKDATMKRSTYEYFTKQIAAYASIGLSTLTLANFLRCHQKYQKYFQSRFLLL